MLKSFPGFHIICSVLDSSGSLFPSSKVKAFYISLSANVKKNKKNWVSKLHLNFDSNFTERPSMYLNICSRIYL